MKHRHRIWHSLLLVILLICVMMLILQSIAFAYFSNSTAEIFKQSLINTKLAETRSFANLINEDFYQFYAGAYGIFSSNTWRNLCVSLERGRVDSQYIEYTHMFWESMRFKQMGLVYIEKMEIYLLEKNKVMTANSIVNISEARMEELRRITEKGHGVSLIDDTLYFWVPQHYSIDNCLEEMTAVAVARLPNEFLHMYLAQFADGFSGPNIMLSFVQDGKNQFSCMLHKETEWMQTAFADKLPTDHEEGFTVIDHGEDSYIVTYAQINNAGLYLYEIVPWNTLDDRLKYFVRQNNLFSMLLLLISLGFAMLMYFTVSRPVRRLRIAIRKLRKGNLSVRLGTTWAVEFQDVYDQFNRMAEQIQTLIEQKYVMQLLHTKAELRQLQYQINPHFLYNTYFNLCALLEEEEIERAVQYADMLGRFLSYITRSGQDGILLEEVEHAEVYGKIQQVRFGNRITLEFGAVPEVVKQIRVPRLILQPLIENAYEHGIKQRLQGALIRVVFHAAEPGVADITVEDNGQSLTPERLVELQKQLENPETVDPLESIALTNIQRRILLYYKNDSKITVGFSELGGLKCRVFIREAEEK